MSRAPRRAMTLIELLVVIAILGTLAGLTAFFMPTIGERRAGGSDIRRGAAR